MSVLALSYPTLYHFWGVHLCEQVAAHVDL